MATEIDISQLPTKTEETRIIMMKVKILHEWGFTVDLILRAHGNDQWIRLSLSIFYKSAKISVRMFRIATHNPTSIPSSLLGVFAHT